jgi:predicted helicase
MSELFAFKGSGVETSRDHLAYDLNAARLQAKIKRFLTMDLAEAAAEFSVSRSNDMSSARAKGFDRGVIREVAYRPLDHRSLYNDPLYVDWPRPDLQAVWGQQNLCLFALPFATRSGPAVWCHSLLPDRHSFRGSYGGYALPLYDRRPGHGPINIAPKLLDGLALAYHAPVDPQVVLDAMLGLLSASSYTLRFAEDLEDVLPHVPFPADRGAFERVAAIGKLIRELETFTRAPAPKYLT